MLFLRHLGGLMKILAMILIAGAFCASAYGSERQRYIHEITSIVKADRKRIQHYEQNPPAGVKPEEAGIYESLVELDLYLVYREIHLYQHTASTRHKVEAKLAQLSRDMENAPEPQGNTVENNPSDRNTPSR